MLSIPHLIIIFVVALVVFGPEKLPELARTLGKVMGEFRRATGDLRSTFEGHLRDLERESEQRRIGGGSNPATAATPTMPPAATMPPMPVPVEPVAPPMTPAEGTVAAEAPRAVPETTEKTEANPERTTEKTTDGGTGAA
jgi:TatA/E family protein of Tat protein translocase